MQTIQMTRDDIAARTGRFEHLQPMEFMKNDTTVSQAAKDIILARKLMPVVLERNLILNQVTYNCCRHQETWLDK